MAQAKLIADVVQDLSGIFVVCEKGASSSAEAQAVLQGAKEHSSRVLENIKALPAGNGASVGTYLSQGFLLGSINDGRSGLLLSLAKIQGGAVPLPRSSKETLAELHRSLQTKTLSADELQAVEAAATLRKLYDAAVSQTEDADAIEVAVDKVMREKVLVRVHGVEQLETQVLQQELSALSATVSAPGSVPGALSAVLSLALNSLQRTHASQLQGAQDMEESSDQSDTTGLNGLEEDDDDEDPFFMPLPTDVVKMADERKFKSLAQPLTAAPTTGEAAPILQMVDKGSALALPSTPTNRPTPATHASPEAPQLSVADFEPIPIADVQRSSRQGSLSGAPPAARTSASGLAPPSRGASLSGAALPALAAASAEDAVAAAAATDAPERATPQGGEQAAADSQPAATPAEASDDAAAAVPAPEDQHKQFDNFLQGQNPQACMFHAQMRLSPEGCRKLAMFIAQSNRVRALSLSHNYLGDEGVSIICEGLMQNGSVTAVDLPDNNITDESCVVLAKALHHNKSLTQLQLSSNSIGDKGAVALAGLIRANPNLKKLGLSNNNIGKAGCKALIEAINATKSLQQLQLLPGNPVEEKDAKALERALNYNKKFSIRSLLGL